MLGSNRDLVNSQVPFAFPQMRIFYAIIPPRRFGSNWDLVNHQVPFAFQFFCPQMLVHFDSD